MKKHITILLLLFFTQLFAQAPQKMSYQAVLRNTSNALIANTSVGMRISILQGNATGTPVFVETQSPTTNANGLVSIEIGEGTIITGTFAGINWSNGPFFIKTETAPNGDTNYTITGTTQVLSVPYALYALNSKQQGKTTIILANDITDAQAAAQITQELGPNTENILIRNTSQLTTVDLSSATSLIDIKITNNTALSTVNFSSLSKLYGDLLIDINSNIATLLFNNLTEVQYINIVGNTNLTSVAFPNLVKTYNVVNLQANENLQSISFPSLISSYNLSIGSNINLNNISLPSLISSGQIGFEANNLLNTISIPALTSCQGITINNNSQLSSVSFNSLTNTGSSIEITQNPQLTTVNLPNLITVGSISLNNPLLNSFDISSLTHSNYLNFNGTLSSTYINAILHKCLTLNPPTGKSIYLNGQSPPAPPTGQGIIDKTTLINTGNNVTTD
jgi:hypothetical protein